MEKDLHISPNNFDRHTNILLDLIELSGRASGILSNLHDANNELSSDHYLGVSEIGIHLGEALDQIEKAERKLHKFVNS